jgi:hypothetical protein
MPDYECDGCGACCGAFHIFASDSDVEREPRIARHARRLPASQETAEWKYQLFPLPFLQACDFLDADNRCEIYATRPDVCRAFAAGGNQCQLARERRGLPVLLPTAERA